MKKFTFSVIAIILSITIYAQESEQLNRHLKRAETAYKMENYKDAIAEYEMVIKLKPDYADAYYNLAVICEKLQTDYYLQRAIEYYKTYMKLVPAEKKIINEKIIELEYYLEKKTENKKHFESMLGVWKTTSYNSKTGQPYCVVEITSFQGKLRIKLLPNSSIFSSTLTNIVATSDLNQDNLLFSYTDDKTYISNPAKWGSLISLVGGIAGSAIGGTGGDIVSQAANAGASVVERSPEQVTVARKFYDFYISEFGNDTLKGLVHQFSSVKDGRTNNVTINYDDVMPIKFVRGSDFYNTPKNQKQIKTTKYTYHYDSLKVVTTLGFNAVFSFLEDPRRFENSVANFGGGINLDFTFITKKSSTKNTKHGFSMGFDFLMGTAAERPIYSYYRYPYVDYEPCFAWNVRYLMGWAGMSKISDKLYFNWGIKPVGLHFLGYGEYWAGYGIYYAGDDYYDNYKNYAGYNSMWGMGICGSVDLGLGIQVSKKCIISPYIRTSYALDFLEGGEPLYRRYVNFSVFPVTLQAGVAFSFLGYHKSKQPREKKNNTSGIVW